MYQNKYSVTWVIKTAKHRAISSTDKIIILESVKDFNNYYKNATSKMTKNRKFISDVRFYNNCVTIKFETEFPLLDERRRGNALRQFSRILSDNGMQVYVYKHRLMRAA